MRVRPSILLSLSLLAGALRPALVVAAELGTAPHFLRLGDRERIVLFSDGPVAGAIADHRADGSIVVTVPEVAAASAIAGREFDDAASGGDGRTKVRITTDAQGAARIEITPADPVGRVHAYATAKPARLTIDLLQKGAPAERSVAKAPVAKVESTASAATKAETAAKAPAKLEVPEAAPAKVDIAASASSKAGPAGGALAQAKHAPGASAKAEPAHVSPAPVPKDVAVGAPVEHATGPAASAAPAATAHVPPRPRDSQQAVASGDAPGPGDRKENADAPGAHVHWDPKLAPAWLGEAHPPSAVPAAGGPGPDAAPADEPDTRDLPVLAIHAAPQQSPLPAPSATPALSVKDGKGRTGKPAATGALANASAPPPVAAAGAPSALAAHDDR
ncbi:MAG: hypothetical protein FJ148_10530, partial [Deltaproteobacteria bacterium]|nr:hypothetical protein [Deltaproteobacteria bacterium]